MLRHKWVTLLAIGSVIRPSCAAQSSKDITAVFNEGKVVGHQYRNDYFGVTLTTEEAEFTQGSFLNAAGNRARLVDARAVPKKFEDRYEVALLADVLSSNPAIHSPEQYLRAVRHGLEREKAQTLDEQFSLEISGVHFVGAIMKVTEGDVIWYRGLLTAFLKGYIFSLDISAATPERVKLLARTKVKFDIPSPK